MLTFEIEHCKFRKNRSQVFQSMFLLLLISPVSPAQGPVHCLAVCIPSDGFSDLSHHHGSLDKSHRSFFLVEDINITATKMYMTHVIHDFIRCLI